MAREHQASAKGAYTIQFELVCQTSSLTRALATKDEHVWFVPTTFSGKPCYRVLWGQYATRDDAAKGIADIPAALSAGSKPVVIPTPK
jgi:septal ring-binding cell division protein DamX